MDRRTFLQTCFTAGAAVGLQPLLKGRALADNLRRVREFNFTARESRVSLGTGKEFTAWTYNGQIPGPEIKVKEGDIIRVVLRNELSQPTTMHWHGLPVQNAVDGVPWVTQDPIAPGDSFIYEFQAKPAGTYFYHSHFRYQLDQGLYGPLIIESSDEPEEYDQSAVLVLEDWVTRDGGGPAALRRKPTMGMGGMMRGMMGRRRRGAGFGSPLLEPIYDVYSVNGKVYPETDPIRVKRGDRVRLKLINACSSTNLYLKLAGHALTVTHMDGQPVKPRETDIIRIGIGERYDLTFRADNPGAWLLAAREEGYGEGMIAVPVIYSGVSGSNPVAPTDEAGSRFLSYWDFEPLHDARDNPDQRVDRFYRQVLSGGMHSAYWTINGQVYPEAESLVVHEGELIRLSYINRSMNPHPMHLHGHFFRIARPGVSREKWIRKDTVIVDPMRAVDIEFVANNPGRWLHHCHNIYHMEAGMANLVQYGY